MCGGQWARPPWRGRRRGLGLSRLEGSGAAGGWQGRACGWGGHPEGGHPLPALCPPGPAPGPCLSSCSLPPCLSSPVGHCLQSPNPAFAQVETQQQGRPAVGVEEGLRAGLPPEGSPGEAAHSPVE